MTRIVAVIENAVVVNMIVADDDMPLDDKTQVDVTDYPTPPGVGWTVSGKTFTAPQIPPSPPPPPDPVTVLRQQVANLTAQLNAVQADVAVLKGAANVPPVPPPPGP